MASEILRLATNKGYSVTGCMPLMKSYLKVNNGKQLNEIVFNETGIVHHSFQKRLRTFKKYRHRLEMLLITKKLKTGTNF